MRIIILALMTIATISPLAAQVNVVFENAEGKGFGKVINRVHSDLFDHTRQGDSTHYSQRLTGRMFDQIGLTKSMAINPGDTVALKVYAKYWTKELNAMEAITNLLSSALLVTSPTGLSIEHAFQKTYGSAANLLLSSIMSPNESRPAAYLNWLIFDEDFGLMDGGYVRINTDAKESGQDAEHDLMTSGKLLIRNKGYIYAYLSNESEYDVYFDDFSMELTPAEYLITEDEQDILMEDGQNILAE